MKSSRPITLGMDPGAAQIGTAVFRGEQLLYYGIKSIKQETRADTLRKLRKVLAKLIEAHGVEMCAIEKAVYVQQERSFVKGDYLEAVRYLKGEGHALYAYHPNVVRRSLCGGQSPTKRNTAATLVRKYRELGRYVDLPKIWQRRYFAQLFDAIAVGLVAARVSGLKSHFPKVSGAKQ